jgi:hypothetical protein
MLGGQVAIALRYDFHEPGQLWAMALTPWPYPHAGVYLMSTPGHAYACVAGRNSAQQMTQLCNNDYA